MSRVAGGCPASRRGLVAPMNWLSVSRETASQRAAERGRSAGDAQASRRRRPARVWSAATARGAGRAQCRTRKGGARTIAFAVMILIHGCCPEPGETAAADAAGPTLTPVDSILLPEADTLYIGNPYSPVIDPFDGSFYIPDIFSGRLLRFPRGRQPDACVRTAGRGTGRVSRRPKGSDGARRFDRSRTDHKVAASEHLRPRYWRGQAGCELSRAGRNHSPGGDRRRCLDDRFRDSA